MSISMTDFWKLAIEGQLMTAEEAGKLAEDFRQAQAQGKAGSSLDDLVRWLIGVKISPYQAKVLLAGRPGPFVYGDYQIYERIESGRLAGIFRALHLPTMHRVCLLFLTGDAANQPEALAQLAQRAQTTHHATVGHPHLFRCYHLVDTGAFKFIVLEDLQGKRVERQLATQGAMTPSEACRIARQAALGLGRLHAMGIPHQEMRPANVWIEPSRNVKLLMFPLARDPLAPILSPAELLQQSGKLPPEADYLAPELIAGGEPDPRSDIYALGATLYHMLTNQAPFPGGDLKSKFQRHAQDKPRPVAELNPQVPAPLAKVINYMLAKDPELRYQNVNTVVEAILPFIEGKDAETQPEPLSRRAQAYEAWLQKKAAPAAAAKPAPKPAPTTEAAPRPAPAKAVAPQSVASPAPVMAAQPMPTHQPVAASQPGMAAPMMAAPVMAAPVQAMPHAAPHAMGGMPVMAATAVPVMGGPVAGGMSPAHAVPGVAAAPAMSGYGEPAPLESIGSGPSIASRARSRRRRQSRTITTLVLLAVIGGGGFAAFRYLGPSSTASPVKEAAKTNPSTASSATPGGGTTGGAQPAAIVPETPVDPREKIFALGEPVWESPTKGDPVDLKYTAPGAQAIIALRPAALAKHPEQAKLLDPRVTGGLGTWLSETLPAMIGVANENLDQVVLSLLDNGAAPPKLAIVARTLNTPSSDDLATAWGGPVAMNEGGRNFYEKGDQVFYIPPAGNGKLIVMGPKDDLMDVILTDGTAVSLPLEVEVLLKQSDQDRLINLACVPRFFLDPAKPTLSGVGLLLREPLQWLLTGADPANPAAPASPLPEALLLSLHLTPETLFSEVRLYDRQAGPQTDATGPALQSRLGQVGRKINFYIQALNKSKYSLEVLISYVEMMQTLQKYVRVGTADKQIVARLYLPSVAAHNLALGTYLSLLENPDSGVSSTVVASGATPSPAGGGNTTADKLKKLITLSFPNFPFDKVSQELLAEEIGLPVRIDGASTGILGITKNQAITNLNEENKPALDVLKVVMLRANPAGNLIYCIVKKDDGGDEIVITTRDGAAKNKWEIPADMK